MGLRSSLPAGWYLQLTASSTTKDSGGPLGGSREASLEALLCVLWQSPVSLSHAEVGWHWGRAGLGRG